MALVIIASVASTHRHWLQSQFSMQTYEYDNGQGTTFTMKFFKGAQMIPATERKLQFDPDNVPGGNIITESGKEAGLTFAIAKANEIDESAREYCSEVSRNVLRYTSKATGKTVPICLLGANEDNVHIFYLTQVEGAGGRHLVQIYKDFRLDIDDTEQKERIANDIDLRKHQEDILYILSSIEEKE